MPTADPAHGAFNFNQIGAIMRWLLAHSVEANLLVTLYQDLAEAPRFPGKIRIASEIVKVLAEIGDDFPDLEAMRGAADDHADEPELKHMAAERGINWKRLMEIATLIMQFLPLFLEAKPERK